MPQLVRTIDYAGITTGKFYPPEVSMKIVVKIFGRKGIARNQLNALLRKMLNMHLEEKMNTSLAWFRLKNI